MLDFVKQYISRFHRQDINKEKELTRKQAQITHAIKNQNYELAKNYQRQLISFLANQLEKHYHKSRRPQTSLRLASDLKYNPEQYITGSAR